MVVTAVLALVTCLDMRQHQQLGTEAVKFHGRFLAGILNEVLGDALYSLGIDKAEGIARTIELSDPSLNRIRIYGPDGSLIQDVSDDPRSAAAPANELVLEAIHSRATVVRRQGRQLGSCASDRGRYTTGGRG